MLTPDITIKVVNSRNFKEFGIYCVKDVKLKGFQARSSWLGESCNRDVTLLVAYDAQDKQVGFIEYTLSENAWRPVIAVNYFFIHCIAVLSKENRDKNIASALISKVEYDARLNHKSGLCTLASKGAWMANRKIFEKFGSASSSKRDALT